MGMAESTDALRPFLIGTAGHVDHGKTTLVQALTGINTDRLERPHRDHGCPIMKGALN